ncbi:Microtubule-associated protein [Gryllus bimaculatus]|nr:Microtubule-associated protein [Gryllus bimaculatus]
MVRTVETNNAVFLLFEPTTNGDVGSPKKSPAKKTGAGVGSPTKGTPKSPVKGSARKPAAAAPAAAAAAAAPAEPSASDKKKVPMNKVQVGAAPSPNLKAVRSKIGSLDNATYKPGGGRVKIEHHKLDFSKTQPKIAAKNETYVPGGGDKKSPMPASPSQALSEAALSEHSQEEEEAEEES